jgi:hypothetical protein
MQEAQTAAQPSEPIQQNGSFKTRSNAARPVLGPWLWAQTLNLGRHTAALRDFRREEFGSGAEAPTEGHILAVNQLMGQLRPGLVKRAHGMNQLVRAAVQNPRHDLLAAVVTHKHLSHSWVKRIEQIWDFYFELFGQRQSNFGSCLLSTDRIALDCYQDAYMGIGLAKSIPAPPPFSYMRTGFGPATYRRGIPLKRLGRKLNPFPLVQLPYHRLVNPWTLGAVLHEVSHNLQSDLGLSRAVPLAIGRRLLRAGLGMDTVRAWVRWNRETFADLSGLLLGGPCIVASLMDVVGRSPEITYFFSSTGVHPTPYLRVLLSLELLRRMGFKDEAEKYRRAWQTLYPTPTAGGFPPKLLRAAPQAMALVVDTVCYQPYQELGGKALSQVFNFGQKEQRMIEEVAQRLGRGTDPGIVPERFLIGAARFALDNRLAGAEAIKENFYKELARR